MSRPVPLTELELADLGELDRWDAALTRAEHRRTMSLMRAEEMCARAATVTLSACWLLCCGIVAGVWALDAHRHHVGRVDTVGGPVAIAAAALWCFGALAWHHRLVARASEEELSRVRKHRRHDELLDRAVRARQDAELDEVLTR